MALWLMALFGLGVQAHPMPESRVWVDTRADGLSLFVQLPLNRLEFAFGQPLADDPASVLERHGPALERYLGDHIQVLDALGGRNWSLGSSVLRVVGTDGSAELEATLTVRAPTPEAARVPVLLFDAVTHEVRTHRVQVFLRNDWTGGFVNQPPLLLGQLAHGVNRMDIPLGGEKFGISERRLLVAGALHIAQGTDHLLFLLMLLLVAPLVHQGRSWQATRPVRQALSQAAWVATAFAVGHSLTLVLGSTGWVSFPSQPVEVAVAVTIAVAAAHALRPLAVRAERWMALLFGLVHGLAFSTSLSGAGLTVGQHALALLSFNLGIELMQLALLACVLPALCIIATCQPRWYGWVRRGFAVGALVLSGVWVAQRLELVVLPDLWETGLNATLYSLPPLLWALAVSQLRSRALAAALGR